jgi:hypothetical protein
MKNQSGWMGIIFSTSIFSVLISASCSMGPRPDTDSKTQTQQPAASVTSAPGKPLTSFSQEITSAVHEITVTSGGTYTLDVTVKNTGTEPWVQQGTGEMPVNAGYRWIGRGGAVLPIEGARASLTRGSIGPGEADRLKLVIKAEPKPGKYSLWVSMVQEGVAWFYDKHAKPLVVNVTIT